MEDVRCQEEAENCAKAASQTNQGQWTRWENLIIRATYDVLPTLHQWRGDDPTCTRCALYQHQQHYGTSWLMEKHSCTKVVRLGGITRSGASWLPSIKKGQAPLMPSVFSQTPPFLWDPPQTLARAITSLLDMQVDLPNRHSEYILYPQARHHHVLNVSESPVYPVTVPCKPAVEQVHEWKEPRQNKNDD